MSDIDSLIRLSRWRVDEKRKALAELEALADHLKSETVRLTQELEREKAIAGAQNDPAPGLGAYVRAALERQAHLAQSKADVESRIVAAREEIAEAFEELKRYEIVQSDRQQRALLRQRRRETATLDEIGLTRHQRQQRST